jgi:hypothetical protein
MHLLIKNKTITISHLALLILVLNGCASMDELKKDMMTNRVIAKQLPTIVSLDQKLIDKVVLDDTKKLKMARNKQIDILLRMSDENYNDFKNFIYTDNSMFESAVGIASLGMTAAATLLTGPVVPILTATDTAMKGAHSTINEKWIQDKTISSIIAAIDTERNKIQARIERGKGKPFEEYTMDVALRDLHEHNNAASMLNGLISLENIAKNQMVSSNVQLDKVKTTAPTETPIPTAELNNAASPGGISP